MSTIPFANPSLSNFSLGLDVNGARRFTSAVQASLVRQGYSAKDAAAYSQVYRGAYDWVQVNWPKVKPYVKSLYDAANSAQTAYGTYSGAKTFSQATLLLQNSTRIGASDAIQAGFSNVRWGGGAGVLSGLVAVMEVVAQKNNVELNPCAMSIAKVSLDLAGMAAGGATAETGFGTVLFVMSTVSTLVDLGGLSQSCGVKR